VNLELLFEQDGLPQVELPEELAVTWESLKVTDQMPFRFILRPATATT